MPGIARVGVDSAGGIITGGGQSTVYCNGALVAVLGDAVAPHGPSACTTRRGHGGGLGLRLRRGAFAVCRAGDAASCGHVASGSGNVNAGG